MALNPPVAAARRARSVRCGSRAVWLALLLLAPACATHQQQPSYTHQSRLESGRRSSSLDVSRQVDAIDRGDYRLSANVNFQANHEGKFTLGNVKEPWDDALRYELDFLFHLPPQDHVEPFAGGFLFWEDRRWSDGSARVDYDAVGFGIETGAIFYPRKNFHQRPFALGLKPYVRFGFAFQDGTFKNVPSSQGFSTGNLRDERLDVTLGLDLHATVIHRLLADVGVGFTYWASRDPDAVTRDGMGVIVDADDRITFRGNDLFFRVGLGFKF